MYVSKYTPAEIEAKLDILYAQHFVPEGYETLMASDGELSDANNEKLYVKLN